MIRSGLRSGQVISISYDPDRPPARNDYSAPRDTTGTLLGEKEAPVKSCRVVLKNADGVYLGQAWTDETGTFEVRSPAGEPGQKGLMVTVRR